jgi:hypothetical protein
MGWIATYFCAFAGNNTLWMPPRSSARQRVRPAAAMAAEDQRH